MYRSKFLYRLQFNNDLILYHYINPKCAYFASAVENFERFLPFKMQVSMFKFNTESLFI